MASHVQAPGLNLPLVIREAGYGDEKLVLSGPGWTLSATCEWRWVTQGGDIISGAVEQTDVRLQELVGDEISGVVWYGPPQLGFDPTFDLASGGELTLLSDAAVGTWALSIPGELVVGPFRP